MANAELIKSFLQKRKKPFCDDCISELTGVSPRQQVNQICNNPKYGIRRMNGGICSHCGKQKIVRSL